MQKPSKSTTLLTASSTSVFLKLVLTLKFLPGNVSFPVILNYQDRQCQGVKVYIFFTRFGSFGVWHLESSEIHFIENTSPHAYIAPSPQTTQAGITINLNSDQWQNCIRTRMWNQEMEDSGCREGLFTDATNKDIYAGLTQEYWLEFSNRSNLHV